MPDAGSAVTSTNAIPAQRSEPSIASIGPTQSPTPPPTSPPRTRSVVAFLLGTALGCLLVGGAWAAASVPTAPAAFTMTGSLTLNDGVTLYPAPGCYGYGGYQDINMGASVTVFDAKGTVVASGYLGKGTHAPGSCTFPIRVENVPGGSDFYQVEVSHRGKVIVQAANARAGLVALSLG